MIEVVKCAFKDEESNAIQESKAIFGTAKLI
jgi:hypothetical protein